MSTVDLAGVRWRKSSFSGNANDDNCVEVAALTSAVAVRDTKAPAGILLVTRAAWTHLCGDVR